MGGAWITRLLLGLAYVLLGVNYAGAPTTGPASIYNGPQVLLEKTDGTTTFAGGDPWKCLTCGVAPDNEQGVITSDFTYPPPHALPGDRKILVGNGILECTRPNGTLFEPTDPPPCPRHDTRIIPIYSGTPLSAPLLRPNPFGNGRGVEA